MFKNTADAIKWIEGQLKFSPKANLERMKAARESLGRPDEAYKIIHVGGTNGKGSVCSFLTNVLSKSYKVGTFTSPYIVSFNERIKINLDVISDAELLKQINEMQAFNASFSQSYGEPLSFFELLTLIALKYFKEQAVDVAILEVGIGGLLDSTNVVESDLALITTIGFDHMQQLGHSLESIASNKLGIVKNKTPLITTVDESLYGQFKAHCDKMSSMLYFIKPDMINITQENPLEFVYEYHTYKPRLLGLHQAKNATLAIAAINYLYPKLPVKTIKLGIEETTWPGRFEVMSTKPLIILDGAHNVHGINALVESLKAYYKKDVHTLFCAMADKDTLHMLQRLSEVSKTMHLTHFDYKRVLDLDILLEQTPHVSKHAHKDPFEAVDMLIQTYPNDIIVITGSLFFVSWIRPFLLNKKTT